MGFRGSITHGTHSTEVNSIDDIDIFGIVIPPPDYLFGIKTFEQFERKEGALDVLVYDFKKFIRLLIKANPNVVTSLWMSDEHIIKSTWQFKELVANRFLFATKQIYKSFCGYSRGQLHKMEHMACEGYMGEKRKELVKRFGFDCKNSSHLIRLLRQGTEFLKTGEFIIKRPDAAELVDIKNGLWPLEKIKNTSDVLFKEMEDALNICTLPESCDTEKINKLVTNILYRTYYEQEKEKSIN